LSVAVAVGFDVLEEGKKRFLCNGVERPPLPAGGARAMVIADVPLPTRRNVPVVDVDARSENRPGPLI
jgi:hypothetical protein